MGHPGYYKTGSLGPGQVFKNGRLNILKRADFDSNNCKKDFLFLCAILMNKMNSIHHFHKEFHSKLKSLWSLPIIPSNKQACELYMSPITKVLCTVYFGLRWKWTELGKSRQFILLKVDGQKDLLSSVRSRYLDRFFSSVCPLQSRTVHFQSNIHFWDRRWITQDRLILN